ncbi:outer membrane protein OmpV [Vibrio caribbeanicus]|uniref:outer membrane protein OmpV n=1 Tax=Vibrio caribbeanicus TaxID=701175 RepID=UPI002285223F|nr:MipA/OmpV family protein [Vibrio caribbeanicus]MCY9843055.1 MipA/OmpV family protein [Vibrio caribbeanicus]
MKKILFTLAALSTTGSAFAGDTYIRNGHVYNNEGGWMVEAGVVHGSDLFKDQKHNTAPVLNGGYHGDDFNADLSGINYRFLGNTNDVFNMSTYLTGSGVARDGDTAGILKGTDKRRFSVDMGLNADFTINKNNVISTYVQHDISGQYDGLQAGATYFHIMNIGNVDLVPFANVSYQSEEYVNHYFGVNQKEATAQRKAYKADSSVNYGLGYKLIMPINDNWQVSQVTQYTRLGNDISDSSIVDSANQWLVGATVAYNF